MLQLNSKMEKHVMQRKHIKVILRKSTRSNFEFLNHVVLQIQSQ